MCEIKMPKIKIVGIGGAGCNIVNLLLKKEVKGLEYFFADSTEDMCYHDCQAFSLLMNEYEEWLSKEQRDEILSIAREVFIESVWEDYV